MKVIELLIWSLGRRTWDGSVGWLFEDLAFVAWYRI